MRLEKEMLKINLFSFIERQEGVGHVLLHTFMYVLLTSTTLDSNCSWLSF
jgi:hypothetical protein